jgi:hypothetical protein
VCVCVCVFDLPPRLYLNSRRQTTRQAESPRRTQCITFHNIVPVAIFRRVPTGSIT